MQEGGGVTLEAAATGIDVGELGRPWLFELILAVFQDGLDRPIAGGIKGVGPAACGFEPGLAETVGQADHPLGGPEVIKHSVGKQPLYQGEAGRTDLFGLFETPLRIPELVGQGVRRHMVVDGAVAPHPLESAVDRHKFVLFENLNGRVGRFEPQGLPNQPIRNRIEVLLEGDMGIAMDLDLGPDRQLHRYCRQGHEQVFLGLGEHRQRLPAGRAMAAVAGLSHDPVVQLTVGIGKIPELPQRKKGPLDVLDAGLDPAFLLRISRRAGLDPEAIAQGQFLIGPLYLGIPGAGPGDGALGVVDDQPRRHPAEPLEGPTVAGQPGLDLLVADDLGILVPGMAESHDEKPGSGDLAGDSIDELRAGAEIDLGGFPGSEIEDYRGLDVGVRPRLEKTPHCRITAGETMVAHQGLVDGGAVDASGAPGLNLAAERFHQRGNCGFTGGGGEDLGQGRFVRQRVIGIQPAATRPLAPDLGCLAPAYETGTGNITVGIP